MIIFYDNNKKITSYNYRLPETEVARFQNAAWYDGEFTFQMAEPIEGKCFEYYWRDGEIETVYFDLPEPEPEPEPEPTQLDRIETAINLSQQEIIDNYTLELIEGGVI